MNTCGRGGRGMPLPAIFELIAAAS